MAQGFASDGGGAVDRVKEAADIVSIVSRVVQLSRSGRGLKGLCPFHHEKTASFHVSPERQAFHCFGCGVGGDVFTFLMNYYGISFRDALEELATEYGIDVSREAPADSGGQLRNLMADAHRFFVDCLSKDAGSRARTYLSQRGLSPGTVEALGIGWAPQGGEMLRHLGGMGYSKSSLIEAGLAIQPDSGATYDRFRERLLFPISDRRNRPVSFGGRSINGAEPKYLNGPDSPLYHKGDLLYGFSGAKAAARDMETVVLVEGYFDHARLFESGLHCAVATCGTAMTRNQARQLVSLAPGVLICYDGDDAGRKAALKASELLLAEGCFPGIVMLEDGLDPDDFIASRGIDSFIGKMETAADPISFAVSLAGGWKRLEESGRSVNAARRLVRIAAGASGPILKEALLMKISEITGYSLEALGSQLAQEAPETPVKTSSRTLHPGRTDLTLIKAVISGEGGGLDLELLAFLDPGDFDPGDTHDLFVLLKEEASRGRTRPVPGDMPPALASLYASITVQLDSSRLDESDRDRVRERIRRKRTSSRLGELRARLGGASDEERAAILREMSDLGSRGASGG